MWGFEAVWLDQQEAEDRRFCTLWSSSPRAGKFTFMDYKSWICYHAVIVGVY